MPVGNSCNAAFSSGRTTIEARHLGRRTGFVDKYQLIRIEVRLGVAPLDPCLCYVGPVLFARVSCFF